MATIKLRGSQSVPLTIAEVDANFSALNTELSTKLTTTDLRNAVLALTLGSGSGLDADKVDGYSPNTANVGNTIVLRDANGDFTARTINASLTGNVTGNVTGDLTGIASNATLAATATNLSGGQFAAVGGNSISPAGPGSNLCALEIGTGTFGYNRTSYIDLGGDDTYTDYGFRIIRYGVGVGANADSDIHHRGTGGLNIIALDAAKISFYTNSQLRASFGNGVSDGATFDLKLRNDGGGSVTHRFAYNENGGEIHLLNNSGDTATLFDYNSGAGTRLLHILSTGNALFGIGTNSNTTGKVFLAKAGGGYALTVMPSGAVGIGINAVANSPTSALHISHDTSPQVTLNTSSASASLIYSTERTSGGSTGWSWGQDNNNSFAITASPNSITTSPRFAITATGEIWQSGVGYTNLSLPSYACRSWMRFAGTSANTTMIVGTYSWVRNTGVVTVTLNNHGMRDGDLIYLDFTTPTTRPADGSYQLSFINGNTFTISVTATAHTTTVTGNVQMSKINLGNGGNVHSIIYGGTGQYQVNMLYDMPSWGYAVMGGGQRNAPWSSEASPNLGFNILNNRSFYIGCYDNDSNGLVDGAELSFAVFH